MTPGAKAPADTIASKAIGRLAASPPESGLSALKLLNPALERLNTNLIAHQNAADEAQVAEVARTASQLLQDALEYLPMDERSLLVTLAGYWDLKARLALSRASLASATRAAQHPTTVAPSPGPLAGSTPNRSGALALPTGPVGPVQNVNAKRSGLSGT